MGGGGGDFSRMTSASRSRHEEGVATALPSWPLPPRGFSRRAERKPRGPPDAAGEFGACAVGLPRPPASKGYSETRRSSQATEALFLLRRRRHARGEVLLLLRAGVPGPRDALRPQRLQGVPVLPLQVPPGLPEEAQPAEGALDQGLPPGGGQGAGGGPVLRVREAAPRAREVPAGAVEPERGSHEASGRDQAEAPGQVHLEQIKEGERVAESTGHQRSQTKHPPHPDLSCRKSQIDGGEDGPGATGYSAHGRLLKSYTLWVFNLGRGGRD